jgi:hypothetical protein
VLVTNTVCVKSRLKNNSEYFYRCQDVEVSDIDMSELLEASGAECWYA